MAVNKEWFPILPVKLRKLKEVPQTSEKAHLHVLHKEEVVATKVVTSTVTVYYWCRVCQEKHPASECRSCDCGVTMCNSCWSEWDVTCPICETDLR